MPWFAYAMRASGVHWTGPRKGRRYPPGDLVTCDGRVVLAETREQADKYLPPGAEVVVLLERPMGSVDLSQIVERNKVH